MLLGILDLNKVTVDDVMIPRHEVRGIDIEEDWEKVRSALANSEHERIPIYRENINQVVGVLHVCHSEKILFVHQMPKFEFQTLFLMNRWSYHPALPAK